MTRKACGGSGGGWRKCVKAIPAASTSATTVASGQRRSRRARGWSSRSAAALGGRGSATSAWLVVGVVGVAGRRRGRRAPDFRARVDLRRTRGMERPGHFGRREQFFSPARQTPPAPHRPAASSMARPGTHRARGRRARRCETCRHDERDALGHQPRALLGEMPLQPEIAFLARRRSGGDERHEQRARGDLLAALSIPRIAADEAALPRRATPPGRPGAAPRRCAPSPPRLATRSWGRRLGRRIRTSRGGLSGGNRKRGHTEKSHVALASAVLRADWAAPFCKPHSDARARRRHASD